MKFVDSKYWMLSPLRLWSAQIFLLPLPTALYCTQSLITQTFYYTPAHQHVKHSQPNQRHCNQNKCFGTDLDNQFPCCSSTISIRWNARKWLNRKIWKRTPPILERKKGKLGGEQNIEDNKSPKIWEELRKKIFFWRNQK